MFMFVPIALSIFITTGWLSFLPTRLDISRSTLLFWLITISCFTFLPPLTIFPSFEIQLSYLLMFGLFLYFLFRIPINHLFAMISLMLLIGSILFLYHELARVQMVWTSPHFQIFTVFFSIATAFVTSNILVEQICLIFGGFLLAQCGILYLYHDQFSPIIFPGEGFLHTWWLTFILQILVYGLVVTAPNWRRKGWRMVIWTKKR